MWQLKAMGAYVRQEEAPVRPDLNGCVRDLILAVKQFYTQAKDSLRSNKDGLSALKDLYAAWLSYLDLLPHGLFLVPTSRNIDAFRADMEQSRRGLEDRKNRLRLELQ